MIKQLVILFAFLLPNKVYSQSYDEAIMVASKAAFKQSGLEAKFILVSNAAQGKGNKFLKDNGLTGVATVGAVVVPVIIYKRLEIHHNDLTFRGTVDKKELVWMFRFN